MSALLAVLAVAAGIGWGLAIALLIEVRHARADLQATAAERSVLLDRIQAPQAATARVWSEQESQEVKGDVDDDEAWARLKDSLAVIPDDLAYDDTEVT